MKKVLFTLVAVMGVITTAQAAGRCGSCEPKPECVKTETYTKEVKACPKKQVSVSYSCPEGYETRSRNA